jgi:hypothetical protein
VARRGQDQQEKADKCPYWDLCPVKKHLVKAYVSTEKRYTVTLKEESG